MVLNKIIKTIVSTTVICLSLGLIVYAFSFFILPRFFLCFKGITWIMWVTIFGGVAAYFGGIILLIWSLRYFIEEGLDNIRRWAQTKKAKK